MTLRRKVKDRSDDTKASLDKNRWAHLLDLAGDTRIFRATALVLLLSMHPWGRAFLNSTLGFKFEDDRKLTVATVESTETKKEVTGIATRVEEIAKDVTQLKANNSILNVKVDNLDKALTGFQIDFSKYRVIPEAKPTNPK